MDDKQIVEVFNKINPKLIRNVCILAHVDHGKTTLADFLLTSNGIISARLAGKLRFMDSREDEQERGITMKTSVVTLFCDPIIINLMDSPGHVDFISEVSSAVNISDIALLIVDVVEGVCSQTEALLRQAVFSHVQVVLVINKMDRLVVELKMSEDEAFRHLSRLIENVNSTLSQIIQGQLIEEADLEKFEAMEKRFHFNPAFGNVIFASAVHGYAFTLADFARLWAPKVKLDEKLLIENLFSDCYLGAGKINPNAESKGKRSLFEQLVLSPLWEVQKCALIDVNLEKLKEFATKLNLPVVKSKQMADAFPEFMRSWLPLSTAVIKSIARCISAQDAFKTTERMQVIFPANDSDQLFNAVRTCNPDNQLCSVFVVKLFCIDEQKVALVRVMSGTLQKDMTLYATSQKNGDSQAVVVESVNLMLGRDVVNVEKAKAGTVVAIQLSDWIQANTLLSESLQTNGLNFDSTGLEPLVRVTVRAPGSGVTEMQELRQALKQLAILDSAVRVFEQEDGDLALVTSGEVHLQKCIFDLSHMGQQELEISEPIVPLLETIVPDAQSSYAKILANHFTECNLKSYNITLKLRAVPLSSEIIKLLQESENRLKEFRESKFEDTQWIQTFHDQLTEKAKKSLVGYKGTWWQRKNEADIERLIENIWTFGPNRAKFNILFNAIPDYDRPSIWKESVKKARAMDRAIVAGFDLAMSQGFLCEEPCQGVGMILEEWTLGDAEEESENSLEHCQDAQLHGQLISAAKQTFRAALKKQPLRLVTPMYHVKVSTSSTMLGKVHTVLSQRHAKVINEEVNEINGLFEINAHMPVAESFSFCEQLRKKTSGASSAQLYFSHWQIIDEDPFWVPTTEDELEEFGVRGDSVNQAKVYMDAVRKRKGLQTDEILVVDPEKQRNLARKK